MRIVTVVLLVVLAACGSDPPSDYTDQSRSNVLTACAGEADRPIVGDVCSCAYRSLRTTVPYQRFAEIDEQLRDQPGSPLPDDVLQVLAACIVEVGEL